MLYVEIKGKDVNFPVLHITATLGIKALFLLALEVNTCHSLRLDVS